MAVNQKALEADVCKTTVRKITLEKDMEILNLKSLNADLKSKASKSEMDVRRLEAEIAELNIENTRLQRNLDLEKTRQRRQSQTPVRTNPAAETTRQFNSRFTTSSISTAGRVGVCVDQKCDVCGGRGKRQYKETYGTCKGHGVFIDQLYSDNHRVLRSRKNCSSCGGRGFNRRFRTCEKCSGNGRVPLKK